MIRKNERLCESVCAGNIYQRCIWIPCRPSAHENKGNSPSRGRVRNIYAALHVCTSFQLPAASKTINSRSRRTVLAEQQSSQSKMASGGNVKMVADTQQVHSQFVTRVSSLPTVEAALEIAMNSYHKLKDASPASIKAVMEVGEKTTNMALSTSQPILNKLQGPIQFVDTLACQGLDRVEQTVPAVKETPDKIISDVKQYGADTASAVVGYGNQKLQQFGLGAVAPERFGEYREQLVSYATVALTAAEDALDSHLASAGAQVPVLDGTSGDFRTRVEHVTAKARLCVSHHTTSRFLAAQKYASDGVDRVLEAVQVIRALKTNVQEGKSVQEIAQELKFEWLSKLLEEAKDKPATQQALFVAQAAAREAQEALNKASGGVKSKVHDAYATVLSRAGELNSYLNNISATQLSNSVLSTIQDQAQHLQKLIQQLAGLNLKQYLPEIRALQQSGAADTGEVVQNKQ